MDTESQWIFDRMRLYKLWQAHPDWSLRQFGRTLGYDKSWVRKWLNRFQTATEKTWRMFVSQSRAPHHCPHRISLVIQLIKIIGMTQKSTFHHSVSSYLTLPMDKFLRYVIGIRERINGHWVVMQDFSMALICVSVQGVLRVEINYLENRAGKGSARRSAWTIFWRKS